MHKAFKYQPNRVAPLQCHKTGKSHTHPGHCESGPAHHVLSKYGVKSDGASCSAPRFRAEAEPNTSAVCNQSSAISIKAASASLLRLTAPPPAVVASLSMLCRTKKKRKFHRKASMICNDLASNGVGHSAVGSSPADSPMKALQSFSFVSIQVLKMVRITKKMLAITAFLGHT